LVTYFDADRSLSVKFRPSSQGPPLEMLFFLGTLVGDRLIELAAVAGAPRVRRPPHLVRSPADLTPPYPEPDMQIQIIASSTMVHHRIKCMICGRPVDHRVVFMTNDARVLHAGCVPDHVKVPVAVLLQAIRRLERMVERARTNDRYDPPDDRYDPQDPGVG
jgi:hypothetical protein